jgi:hypothetical protein
MQPCSSSVELRDVAAREVVEFADVGVDDTGVFARHQPLVQALQRKFARAPARRPGRRLARGGRLLGGNGFAHPISSSRLAISTATRAASVPFSSARAQAWASFSTVRMALAIGIWWSSDTRVTPAPLSLATSSKW